VDIKTIHVWLEHVSLTTNVYGEIDLEMKAKALAKCQVTEPARGNRRWREDPKSLGRARQIRLSSREIYEMYDQVRRIEPVVSGSQAAAARELAIEITEMTESATNELSRELGRQQE